MKSTYIVTFPITTSGSCSIVSSSGTQPRSLRHAEHKHPSHAPPTRYPPWSLSPPTQKLPSRARLRPTPPPSSLAPSTASQPVHRSSSQRLSAYFQSSCLLLAMMQVIAEEGGGWRGRNEVKIVEVDSGRTCTPFYISGVKTAFSDPRVALARRKCTINGATRPGLV